jgi:hypothetical protein
MYALVFENEQLERSVYQQLLVALILSFTIAFRAGTVQRSSVL